MERSTQGLPACEMNWEIEEIPIRFSLFDLYSWSWFWSYKRYRVKFPNGPHFKILRCSAILNKETKDKDEWILLVSVDFNCETVVDNSVVLVIPCRRNSERVSFSVLQNPPVGVTIKIE